MATNKITLNELRSLVRQVIKEEVEMPNAELKKLGDVIKNSDYKYYGETNGIYKYIKVIDGEEIKDNEIHISKETFDPSYKYSDPQAEITPFRVSFLFGRFQAHPRFKDIDLAIRVINPVLAGNVSIKTLQDTYLNESTTKITLNELRSIVKQIIKENLGNSTPKYTEELYTDNQGNQYLDMNAQIGRVHITSGNWGDGTPRYFIKVYWGTDSKGSELAKIEVGKERIKTTFLRVINKISADWAGKEDDIPYSHWDKYWQSFK